MTLTKKQTKQLRALANTLKPLIQIGKNDLSDTAVQQAEETLERRELMKCQVLDGSGMDAKEAAQALAERLGAEVVQVIGNRFVVYRRSKRDDVDHIPLVRD
ncbi:YhbY family RNA-binding protein [Bifidobacterium cuniculi]|uniref:RNA-binding protein, YhbY family n=1 Tax=Bifidobacterium cuniculi TaxID=1688 RepID=A0A087ACA7_9BIFI|nr:YhbY family RNA-binding protein [Bifidobacterium cuniculi]KFI56407.1 RNA-binding protein, YhbY family [Bifidobacterium cuniculi]